MDAASLIDSRLLGRMFVSTAMRAVFGDRRVMQRWLDVEAALAFVQGELDIIPAAAAATIEAHASATSMDIDRVSEEISRTAHPLVPVIRALEEACGEDGQYVHFGATTQDVTDTGTVLLVRDALARIDADVARLEARLLTLAQEYRNLVMAGRTHGQQALPITLGFKFAVFASEVKRHRSRLGELRPRVLVGQFGGAVGTLASLGERGLDVLGALCARLELVEPDIAWHTARDGFAELVGVLSMIAATCGKIANEVRQLQRSEIAEWEEPNALGKIGSSTMPHKRNPMIAENVVAMSKLTRQAMPLALDAMVQEHERDMGLWGVEWAVIPETFCYTAGALEYTQWILDGLRIDQAAIERNLQLLGGLMMTEAVMMRLSASLGKQRAHELLYQTSMQVVEEKRSLLETLRAIPEVIQAVGDSELEALLDPHRYAGSSSAFVDRVVAAAAHERPELSATTGGRD